MYPIYSTLPVFVNCLRRAGVDTQPHAFFSQLSVSFYQGRNTPRLPVLKKMVPFLQPATYKYRLPMGDKYCSTHVKSGPSLQNGVKEDRGTFQTQMSVGHNSLSTFLDS